MVLSSQTFQNSDCLQTSRGYSIQNRSMSVSAPSLVESNGSYFGNNLTNSSITGAYNSGSQSIPMNKGMDFQIPETCYTSITTVIAIIVITLKYVLRLHAVYYNFRHWT